MNEPELTQDETQELVRLLKKLKPGFYPIEIFWEFCRLIKTTSLEVVPFVRDENGNIKVVLIKRPHDDKFWPDSYHNPGCIVRPNDTFAMALNRVIEEELEDPKIITPPVFFDVVFSKYCRGENIGLINWIELDSNLNIGEAFDIGNFPENMVKEEIPYIIKAAQNFKEFLEKNKR